MIRTVVNVTRFDYGFRTDNIFTARLGLFEKDYPTPQAQLQFYDGLIARLEGQPGVRAVAFTSDLPGRGTGQMHPLTVDGVAYPTNPGPPRSPGALSSRPVTSTSWGSSPCAAVALRGRMGPRRRP